MAEEAPNTAMAAILTIIVIFVVAITFYVVFPETASKYTAIFEEVFGSEKAAAEQAKSSTLEAQKSLTEGVNGCATNGEFNSVNKDNCFCFTQTFGVISDQSYFQLVNAQGTLQVTAIDAEGVPLEATQEKYNLGLAVLRETGYDDAQEQFTWELGCVFPSTFFIKGMDKKTTFTGQFLSNDWHIIWQDPRAKEGLLGGNKYQEFLFYGEKGEPQDLVSAPVLYRIDNSHYCLITDLIEKPLNITEADSYTKIAGSEAGNPQIFTGFESDIFTDAKFFFLDDSRYCNK